MSSTISKQRTSALDLGGFTCPLPLNDYPNIILSHGGGGKLSAELVEHVFLPAFSNPQLAALGDSAVIEMESTRLALSTDSYVVQPLFFPGGSIGDLAVNGTVNDLAMSGARPLHLTAGFILEEGFPISQLNQIALAMGAAARSAGVTIVAGDTKVVQRGHGDGCYINTAGIGTITENTNIHSGRAQSGDAVILSGTIGDHGMAIMSVREGLEFESQIKSDSAPLHEMVASILSVCPDVHVLRDPTRGGLSASLNEIARASNCGIEIEEASLPINESVQSACEILGLDPMLVANEGKLVCIAPAEFADKIVETMRANEFGKNAATIGRIVASHPTLVVAKTAIGANRVVTLPLGEQLPRIC